MGDEKQLLPIPAYLELGGSRVRVLKLGVKGLVAEWSAYFQSQSEGGKVKVNFIFPYDGYSEIVLKEVNLQCQLDGVEEGKEPPEEVYCKFVDLTKEQEEFFRLLVRDYLWRRIVSIPSEFMNYTQDEEVRRELLALQKKIELKKKLKKLAFVGGALGVLLFAFFTPAITKFLFEKRATITVKYREEKGGSSGKAEKNSDLNLPLTSQEPKVKKVESNLPQKPNEIEKKEVKPVAVGLSVPSGKIIPAVKVSYENSVPEGDISSNERKAEKEEKTSSLNRTKTYYCVQVASDFKPEGLIKEAEEFSSLPYIRVEKIGKVYTLRIGFWEDRNEAKRYLKLIKRKERGAFWRTCAYKPERWVYSEGER